MGDFSPRISVAYLRGHDLHLRGVCVTPNKPYSVMGMSPASCGDAATLTELMNATKNRVRACTHRPDMARAVCRGVGLFCEAVDDPLGGQSADINKVTYFERAALAPMEFFDYNYGHIVTDGAMAVAAVRAGQTGAVRSGTDGDAGLASTADGVPTFLWRARSNPIKDLPLKQLWERYMAGAGLRYLPVGDGAVCFGTVTILAQPLNMLSWQRLASAPFLRMAEAWGAYARLIQFPADHPARDAFFGEDAIKAAAAAIDAAGEDPGMGGVSREVVLARSRALRKALTDKAPPDLLTGPSCAVGAAGRRKPRVLAIQRTGKRKVVNMDAVLGWFRERGYEAGVWKPEGKGPKEQAEEIQQADVFLSNHGQGQAWGMFMREDAVMMTVCSDNQLRLGSCTYYAVAARNGGHSPRRVFTLTSSDAHYYAGGHKSDEFMRQELAKHGGKDGSDWHYKSTHWDDIDVKLDQLEAKWKAHLGGSTGDADDYWAWWCKFDDVIDAANDADGERLPTRDRGTYLATRLPRLGEDVSLV